MMRQGPSQPDDLQGTGDPQSRGRFVYFLAAALLVVLAVTSGILAWKSMDWPLIQDPPLMNYIAWRIQHGAVPYRDLFDMNFPGSYLLHLGVLKIFGPSDFGWRMFDLAWLGLTMVIIAVYCRRSGLIPCLAAVLIYALYHLAGGAFRAGQRDFLLVAFLLAGCHFVARFCEGMRTLRPLVVAGLAIGCAMMIKPLVGAFWLFLAVFSAIKAGRAGRAWWGPLLAVMAGGLVPVAGAAAWLGAIGGLGAFLDILTGYLPLYARLARAPFLWLLSDIFMNRFFVVLVGIALAPLCQWLVSGRGSSDTRRQLLAAGLVYGIAHFVLQRKGWTYHQEVQMAFACLLVAAGLGPGTSRGGRRSVPWTTLAALIVTAALGAHLAATPTPCYAQRRKILIQTLMADIEKRSDTNDRVQVMDWTDGGIDSLLRLRRPQATAFIYDFHFYHHRKSPYIQRLRKRFLGELGDPPPKLLILFERGCPPDQTGYKRLQTFPELLEWLEKNYTIDIERAKYRVYVRTDNRQGRPVLRQ